MSEQLEAKNLVIKQIQGQSTDTDAEKDSLIEEVELLKTQLEEREILIDQEKAEVEEQHQKELDEVTETGMSEISELEAKVDQEQEKADALEAQLQAKEQECKDKMENFELKYEEKLENTRSDYEKEIDELMQQITALTASLENLTSQQTETSQKGQNEVQTLKRQISMKEDGTTQILMKFQDELIAKD